MDALVKISNSYTMGCPPVRGDNRALASGLPYVQVNKHGTTILQLFYTIYISVDHAHHEIVRATVSKGGKRKVTEESGHINLRDGQQLNKVLFRFTFLRDG